MVVPECYLQYNRVCKLNQVGCLIVSASSGKAFEINKLGANESL